ncbi:MAG: ADP-ribose pyrophosphatase YjhB (NUDIX family) [Colwellia sp.]|jgi:ADP-ribose pyrophosphatase YjhB (NUDIX family)
MTEKQYGVLPFIKEKNKQKVVLISSCESKKWIVPKGHKINKLTKRATALQEAFEEAGIKGYIKRKKPLIFEIKSHGKTVTLVLYFMKVKELLLLWPENKKRKRKIVKLTKAKEMVAWQGLSDYL